MVFANQ